MKVTILANDLSMNSLGRVGLLASLIERNHEVEIVGPQFSDEVWYPMRDRFEYKSVRSSSRSYRFIFDISEIIRKIEGDVLYASKPLVSSFGIGLLAKYKTGKPLILDIDDWESGFLYTNESRIGTYLWNIVRSAEINSLYFIRFLEKIHKKADSITVSNRFLQNKFGGTLVPHVRDTTQFDPQKFDQKKMKKELNLPTQKRIIMFSGTPRPHKGLGLLIKACNQIPDEEFAVVLVGAERNHELIQKLPDSSGYQIFYEGIQPFSKLPQYIAASDIICVPQRDTASSVGQLPAKLFDAMSMGKPIVTTSVSDIPEIIGKGGLVVPPDEVDAIRTGLLKLLQDKELRVDLGRQARSRCVEEYSINKYATVIDDIIMSCIE
ncbi:glycosyltransferase family 4 protein [Halorubrum sp. CGM4_25_10-8A]|uniref:glycosyltransferase family 4 protein n=1 Tax=Halorubrum sp. CGM4_25_10-8A TaxID=2518116 RepID=UPI0010F92AF1|nr:glycosyltransferase family 4 protein [Halorubrum sp. CGM4_25_10-8A]TKX40349.1 glycosyltransferase [Halorubrum sp. CGM4_25_10-8A]